MTGIDRLYNVRIALRMEFRSAASRQQAEVNQNPKLLSPQPIINNNLVTVELLQGTLLSPSQPAQLHPLDQRHPQHTIHRESSHPDVCSAAGRQDA